MTESTALISPRDSRRVSVMRLTFVALVAAVLLALGSHLGWTLVAESEAGYASAWFAPYVDLTLTPISHFEDPAEQPASNVVLGFIVADPKDACEPSWGGYYSLDAAARALDVDRRIVRLRERGGDAVISLGGAANQELAVACKDPAKLLSAYRQVVDRYGARVLDFDVEGEALSNAEANTRRAEVLKQLEMANPSLSIWLTVPADPSGLPEPALNAVSSLLHQGVNLSGVNLMTMNYGESRPAGKSMAEASIEALDGAFQQLDGLYKAGGVIKSDIELWRSLGATPMIGQNDVALDVFTLQDAEDLLRFARERGVGRLSFWSANRDVRCGAAITDRRASNTCSGVDQQPLEFGELFTKATTSKTVSTTLGGPTTSANLRLADGSRDDPRTSPYPLWRSAKAYEEGSKVVWQGRVYQAKWWTQGNQPDAPVKHTWDTPWRYLGPVIEGDLQALAPAPSVDGQYPHWSGERVYVAGDKVELDGSVFQAKWWTQGDKPEQDPDQPYDHPWEYVGKAKSNGG